MKNLFRISLILLGVSVVAPPLGADSNTPSGDEPQFVIDLESTSHVVRQDEDRLNLRYNTGKWRFEGLAASLSPRFRDDSDQIGVLVQRAFCWGELTAVARQTNKPIGDDIVASVSYQRTSGEQAYGGELTFGQADLASDDFVLPDGEDQFVGRVFWRRGGNQAGGLEVSLFAAGSATFDLTRNLTRGEGVTDQLLRALPRSEIVGGETLTDLYVDEDVLEDSAGVVVGFARQHFNAHVYAKGGEQTIRGIPFGDDFTGFGADVHIAFDSWSLDTEFDVRQIDPTDGFGSLDRGRLLFDFRHRPGRWTWGLGGYMQGESESLSEIPDFYDTAGFGVTLARGLASGREIGLWTMWEDNAPEEQVISRLGVFYRASEREYGVGVRRDEIGTLRFKEETIGPFFFFKIPLAKLLLDANLGVQDGETYGQLSIAFKR